MPRRGTRPTTRLRPRWRTPRRARSRRCSPRRAVRPRRRPVAWETRTHEHVEQQREHGALTDADEQQADDDRDGAPIVADCDGDYHQTDRDQDERGDTETARREAVVQSHRKNARGCDGNRVREDGDRRGQGRAALADLNVERDEKAHCEGEAARYEERDDGTLLLAPQYLHRKQRLLFGCDAPVRPRENAWPSTIPTRIRIGAGDTRSSENGAAALATSGPHVWRLLNPNRMRAIAAAERTNPKKSILMPGWRLIGVSRKL